MQKNWAECIPFAAFDQILSIGCALQVPRAREENPQQWLSYRKCCYWYTFPRDNYQRPIMHGKREHPRPEKRKHPRSCISYRGVKRGQIAARQHGIWNPTQVWVRSTWLANLHHRMQTEEIDNYLRQLIRNPTRSLMPGVSNALRPRDCL